MLTEYLPLFISLVLALGLAALVLGLGWLLGPRRATKVKQEVFECGNPSTGPARERFNVKFYLVAILFLVFDIEATFVYPWAVVFSDAAKGAEPSVSPMLAVLEMVTFVGIVVVGLAYAWRKGALEWGPERPAEPGPRLRG